MAYNGLLLITIKHKIYTCTENEVHDCVVDFTGTGSAEDKISTMIEIEKTRFFQSI